MSSKTEMGLVQEYYTQLERNRRRYNIAGISLIFIDLVVILRYVLPAGAVGTFIAWSWALIWSALSLIGIGVTYVKARRRPRYLVLMLVIVILTIVFPLLSPVGYLPGIFTLGFFR